MTTTNTTPPSATPDPGATAPPSGHPVAWFEIGAPDAEAARRFYGGAFGWTFAPETDSYTLITAGEGPAPSGGIRDTSLDLPAGAPSAYAVPCVQVPDVAEICGRVPELGGKVVVGPTTAPTGLVFAYVADPAGSVVGLFTPPGP